MTMTVIQVPERMTAELDALVESGWFSNETEVIQAALWEFIRRNRFALAEHFQRADIAWALQQDREDAEEIRRLREAGEEAIPWEQAKALPHAPVQPESVSYEQFLAWADEDTLAEWVDGEIVMTSPASNLHQDHARFLTAVLSVFVEVHALGVVRPAPFQMKLAQGREPDLLFVAAEHLPRLRETYLDGPADLVVEIVSPESRARDRGAKYYEYESGGVSEYWLLDPQRRWAEFYHLEDDRYRLVFAGEEGQFRSTVLPGFWLRIEWLWQQPLPPVLDVLRELGLI